MSDDSTAGAKAAASERRRMSRTGQAYEVISNKLADLTYRPGSTFTEGELVTSLGLTKTPVREALLMLSVTGLVIARPGAGYMVSPLTLKDVRSLCNHWRRLEGDAAAITAGLGLSSVYVVDLTDLARGEGAYANSTPAERDVELHSWIVDTAGDEYLSRDFAPLAMEILRLYRLTLGDAAWLQEMQLDLVRAVVGDSAAKARAAVIAHVDHVERQVIDTLLRSDALMTTNLGLPVK